MHEKTLFSLAAPLHDLQGLDGFIKWHKLFHWRCSCHSVCHVNGGLFWFLSAHQTLTFRPAVTDHVLTWPRGCWVSSNEFSLCLPSSLPLSLSLSTLSGPWTSFKSKIPFMGCHRHAYCCHWQPAPLLLPGWKKLVSAPTLAVKEMCVFAVCPSRKCVLLSLAVIDIMGWVVCVCVFMCASVCFL